MSDETSPRPWRIEEEPSELGFVAYAADGELLFTGEDFTLGQARLIATAVNHHDELVALMKAAMRPAAELRAAAEGFLARIAKEMEDVTSVIPTKLLAEEAAQRIAQMRAKGHAPPSEEGEQATFDGRLLALECGA